jgi:hypothetical protein
MGKMLELKSLTGEKKRLAIDNNLKQRLFSLMNWIIGVSVAVLGIYACGQIALMGGPKIAYANAQSELEADYGSWKAIANYSIRSDIVEVVQKDQDWFEQTTQDGGGDQTSISPSSSSEVAWVNPSPEQSAPPSAPTPVPRETQPLKDSPAIVDPLPDDGQSYLSDPGDSEIYIAPRILDGTIKSSTILQNLSQLKRLKELKDLSDFMDDVVIPQNIRRFPRSPRYTW